MGETHGFLVSAVGNGNALHAHSKTGCVHHDEHVLQATVFFTHQVANGTAVVTKLQHRRRAGLDAQLVLDRHTPGVIACAQRAIVTHHEFGHQKQRDALDTLGRARHAGQHEMNDVFSHVVLTIGDVDLGAKHLVSAVGLPGWT